MNLFSQRGVCRFQLASFLAALVLATVFFLGLTGLAAADEPADLPVVEQPTIVVDPVTERFAGATRYQTALAVSANWYASAGVVLTRGDDFPDALAGAVLANAPHVAGPLLLTEPTGLTAGVLEEIRRLAAQQVYILGGTGAVSAETEQALRDAGLTVTRLSGTNRYETAAAIAKSVQPYAERIFLASGSSYADALSISPYAAAHSIPLLLTEKDSLPAATKLALEELGAYQITLIGGEGVISPALATELAQAGYMVDRLAGSDRYLTNIAIVNNLEFNHQVITVATGRQFPDALAGSVLAARGGGSVLLVPDKTGELQDSVKTYLNDHRATAQFFYTLGGEGAVSKAMEQFVTSVIVPPAYPEVPARGSKISLQFWDGYNNYDAYVRQLSFVPDPLSDYIDILAPSFHIYNTATASVTLRDQLTEEIARSIVLLGQERGALIVPFVRGDGTQIDQLLGDASRRQALVDNLVSFVETSGADGIMIDFEMMAVATEDELTALMQALADRLQPQGKLVMVAVMSKTAPGSETWNDEYNYHDLGNICDYVLVMSYDQHYTTSAPGAIASLDWVRRIMTYATSQISPEKIIMGVPYYGRDWWWSRSSNGWLSEAFGWAIATKTAAENSAEITRETTPTDPVGVPTFTYVDADGDPRTAYFDDPLSWDAKFDLLYQFNLAGFGGWSLGWINEVSAPELYPLLYAMR
jgi:putative cell wall-binding protein